MVLPLNTAPLYVYLHARQGYALMNAFQSCATGTSMLDRRDVLFIISTYPQLIGTLLNWGLFGALSIQVCKYDLTSATSLQANGFQTFTISRSLMTEEASRPWSMSCICWTWSRRSW